MDFSQRELVEPKYLNQPGRATKQFCTVTLTQRTSREGGNKKRMQKEKENKKRRQTKWKCRQMCINSHPPHLGASSRSLHAAAATATTSLKPTITMQTILGKAATEQILQKPTAKKLSTSKRKGTSVEEGGGNFAKEPKADAGTLNARNWCENKEKS
uniref:5'-3' exoribonuclease 2 n=1 Tax=Zeugodacus cucurbitae TaxID=28588 RepID=A0A0A1X4J5_ZEUCU